LVRRFFRSWLGRVAFQTHGVGDLIELLVTDLFELLAFGNELFVILIAFSS